MAVALHSSSRQSPAPSRRSQRGSVVVIVLITLLFAALFLTRLIELNSTDLLVAMREADRSRLRADAYDALETTLAVLEDFRAVDGALYAPAQGWADPLGYAGYTPREGVTITVSFEDESAKLSLPQLTVDQLAQLFVQLGIELNEAVRIADAMATWMKKDHIAAETATSAAIYEQSEPHHQPPRRSLRSFDELASIAVARDYFYNETGTPTELWHQFTQSVSLYDFSSTNLNSVGPDSLLIAGWDGSQADALYRHFATPVAGTTGKSPQANYLRSMGDAQQLLGKIPTSGLGVEVRCLRINILAQQGAARLLLSAMVAPGQTVKLPPAASPPAPETEAAALQPPTPPRSTNANTAGQPVAYPYTVLELRESNSTETLPGS